MTAAPGGTAALQLELALELGVSPEWLRVLRVESLDGGEDARVVVQITDSAGCCGRRRLQCEDDVDEKEDEADTADDGGEVSTLLRCANSKVEGGGEPG